MWNRGALRVYGAGGLQLRVNVILRDLQEIGGWDGYGSI